MTPLCHLRSKQMAKVRSKNEQKRKQILEAATLLFTEKGYASTSMDLIANQAQVSKQTVYSHFGNKDELFGAAIKQKCDAFQLVDFELCQNKSPKEVLLELSHRFFTMIVSKEAVAVHKICAFEAKSYPQVAETFFSEGPNRVCGAVTQLMDNFVERGVLSIPDTRFAAFQLLHMIKGEAWMRIEYDIAPKLSQEDIDHYIENCVDLFLRGYQPTS